MEAQMAEEHEKFEKDRIADDRIFLGAAVLLSQRSVHKPKEMSENKMRSEMREAIRWASILHDEVEGRRAAIQLDKPWSI
jgi:hypothetical protein